jgi:hypothetical protein
VASIKGHVEGTGSGFRWVDTGPAEGRAGALRWLAPDPMARTCAVGAGRVGCSSISREVIEASRMVYLLAGVGRQGGYVQAQRCNRP